MPIRNRPDSKKNPDYDAEASLREARSRMPLARMLEQRGIRTDKRNFACPFCGSQSAGLFKTDGIELFKCFHTSCPTETKALDEVGFIMQANSLNRKDAFRNYLKEAGVWKERTTLKGVKRGSDVAQQAKPIQPLPPLPPLQQTDQPLLESSTSEPASGSAESGLPPAIADQPLPEPPLPEPPTQPLPPRSGLGSGLGRGVLRSAMEIILAEQVASVAMLQRRLKLGFGKANALMKTLEERGMVGPAKDGLPREILFTVLPDLPDLPDLPEVDEDRESSPTGSSQAGSSTPADAPSGTGDGANPPAQPANTPPVAAPSTGNPAGSGAGGVDAVPQTEPPNLVVLPSAQVPPSPRQEKEKQAKKPDPALEALKLFYSKLTLTDADKEKLYLRRGIYCGDRLGFRSNLESNKGILTQLADDFTMDVLVASGLWKASPKSKARKPNAQFYGAGIVRKLGAGEKPGPNEWSDDESNLWGWCHPILIPYFDAFGQLVKLRPHKGGAKGSTSAGAVHLYIPRDPDGPKRNDGSLIEEFHDVLITEGEFKSGPLWQSSGAGRVDGLKPWGIAALPGISFAKHYDLRQELDHWLRRVHAHHVVVAFDNEEKGDPKLPGYKSDWNKRFDSQIWARVLAIDLADKLRLRAMVGTLPAAWRDSKGKADWDGAAAMDVKTLQKTRMNPSQ